MSDSECSSDSDPTLQELVERRDMRRNSVGALGVVDGGAKQEVVVTGGYVGEGYSSVDPANDGLGRGDGDDETEGTLFGGYDEGLAVNVHPTYPFVHNDGAVVERPYAVADLGCGLPPVNVNLDCGGYVVEHVENAGLGVYVNIEGVVGRLEAGGADMGPVITKARKVNEVASEVKVRR